MRPLSPQVKGSLPELVRKTVEHEMGPYCEERVPPHARHKIKMEYRIRGKSVTLIERRPSWRPELPPEWSTLPVAQMRYEEGKWALYWSDRNSRWYRYDELEPTADLSAVLTEINEDPTAIFWG